MKLLEMNQHVVVFVKVDSDMEQREDAEDGAPPTTTTMRGSKDQR